MLNIGKINKLKIIKETNIAYTLSNGENEVFLHFNQSLGLHKIGEEVDAFLYYDQKKRLCATLETPIISVDKYDFVKVVSINDAGVFVNIGISKDILLSKDYLATNFRLWPKIDDLVPCYIKVKKNQLVASVIDLTIKNDSTFNIGEEYTGTVISISKSGLIASTDDFNLTYINNNLLRKEYRVGQEIKFKVIELKNNIYISTTIENKEKEMIVDSEAIIKYLNTFGGMLPLGNASTPDEIFKLLHMSKSAFKRAVGHLYKEKIIEIMNDKIILINK